MIIVGSRDSVKLNCLRGNIVIFSSGGRETFFPGTGLGPVGEYYLWRRGIQVVAVLEIVSFNAKTLPVDAPSNKMSFRPCAAESTCRFVSATQKSSEWNSRKWEGK